MEKFLNYIKKYDLEKFKKHLTTLSQEQIESILNYEDVNGDTICHYIAMRSEKINKQLKNPQDK